MFTLAIASMYAVKLASSLLREQVKGKRGGEREGVERKGRDRRGRRGGNGCLNIICMQKPVLPDSCIVHDVQRYTFHCSQVNMFGNNLQIGPHM